jgi:hypothetical protein
MIDYLATHVKKYIEHQFNLFHSSYPGYQFFNKFCSRPTLVGEYLCSKPILSHNTNVMTMVYVQWKTDLGWQMLGEHMNTTGWRPMFYHLLWGIWTANYPTGNLHTCLCTTAAPPCETLVFKIDPALLRRFWAPWTQSDPGRRGRV